MVDLSRVPIGAFGLRAAYDPVGHTRWVADALIVAGWILATRRSTPRNRLTTYSDLRAILRSVSSAGIRQQRRDRSTAWPGRQW